MGKTIKAEIQPDVIVKGRARFDLADASLKQWARDYQDCKKDIERLTGAPYSPPSKRSGFVSSDEANNYRSQIINGMSPYNRMFLQCHYLERDGYIGRLYESIRQGINEGRGDYSMRVKGLYFERLGTTRATYYRDLKDAQDEFIARGGI